MVSEEALKKLQEQIAAWPMAQRFVVQQLIWEYLRNREDVRAYEATGLTAEEVSTRVKDWNDLCTIVGECGGITRVKALAEADKEGRVVVTRCKDCKYSCEDGTGRTCEGYWHELSEFAVSVKDNDFCSYGKPKEG